MSCTDVRTTVWVSVLFLLGVLPALLSMNGLSSRLLDASFQYQQQQQRQEQQVRKDDNEKTPDGCSHFVTQEYDLFHHIHDLHNSSSSGYPRWIRYSKTDIREAKQVTDCLDRMSVMFPKMKVINPVRPDFPSEDSVKLDCHDKLSLPTLRTRLQNYTTIWFIGDSILAQQYYALICMVDPTLGGKSRFVTKHNFQAPVEDRYHSFVWNHGRRRRRDGRSTDTDTKATKLVYSQFGRRFAKWAEVNLYQDDFPMAIQTLTATDAIVLNAAAHYDSSHSDELTRALHFIAQQAKFAKASVFFMEPVPEEWPTSNGMFTKACQWRCHCEVVNALRLVGRGNYSDPTDHIQMDLSTRLFTPVHSALFQQLYPDLDFAQDVDGDSPCIPDCVPAMWRVEAARSILSNGKENEASPSAVTIVPLFWQLLAKDTPSGRGATQANIGDCTHKTLDVVLVMNEQLVRTMSSLSLSFSDMSLSRPTN